jgi:hypothetical protein
MADLVQERLDSMVVDLKDLFDKGIFTESEIKAIVDRRRQSEYLLRRKKARKVDFLRYAEAEMALERLRSIRQEKAMEGRLVGVQREKFEKFLNRQKQSMVQAQQDTVNRKRKSIEDGNTGTKTKLGRSSGDASIIRNIHLIFVRMKRKWKSDVALHLAHADFAKRSRSFQRLGSIYAEALQILPKSAILWIEAASHEFFGYVSEEDDINGGKGSNYTGGSVHAARVLLQRGLRVNPRSEDLWVQYFALEFHFIQKMRGRREILKIDSFQADRSTRMLSDDPLPPDDTKFFEGSIPTVVYNNAIKTIPDNVSFRLKFLDVCKQFPDTDMVQQIIVQSIDRDFGENPDAWIAQARFALVRPNLLSKIESDGSPDSTERADFVGFLMANDNCDEETHSEQSHEDTSLEESSNRTRKSQGNLEENDTLMNPACVVKTPMKTEKVAVDPVDVSCTILSEASSKIRTSAMLCKCMEFLLELFNIKEFNTKRKRSKLVQCYESLEEKVDSYKIESSEIVHWRARLLSEIGRRDDAIQLLLRNTSDKALYSGVSKLWLLLVDLMQHSSAWDSSEASQEHKFKSFSDTLPILRRAMQRIPVYDPNYIRLQGALFDSLLVIKSKSDLSADRELKDLFQGILLSCSRQNLSIRNGQGTDLADFACDLCLKYMQLSLISGGPTSARVTYSMIIFQFLTNLSFAISSEKLMYFFQSCLQLEKSVAQHKNATSKEKVTARLRRMYDSIGLFLKQHVEVHENAQVYLTKIQQLQHKDLGHYTTKISNY